MSTNEEAAPAESPADRWLLRKEAAKFMKIGLSSFDELRKAGVVTGHSLTPTTRVKYDREELRKLLEPETQEAK